MCGMYRHPGGFVDVALCFYAAQWPRCGGLHRGARDGEERHDQRQGGGVDFYSGGDINIEISLVALARTFRESTASNGMYGMCGTECRGGGEDVITCEQSVMVTVIEGVQLHSDEHLH